MRASLGTPPRSRPSPPKRSVPCTPTSTQMRNGFRVATAALPAGLRDALVTGHAEPLPFFRDLPVPPRDGLPGPHRPECRRDRPLRAGIGARPVHAADAAPGPAVRRHAHLGCAAAHHAAAGQVPHARGAARPGRPAPGRRRGRPGPRLPGPGRRRRVALRRRGAGPARRRAQRQRATGPGHRLRRARGGRPGRPARRTWTAPPTSSPVGCARTTSGSARPAASTRGARSRSARRNRPTSWASTSTCRAREARVMTDFGSVKIVGGLLPADLLGRVFAGDPQVPGTGPETYGLERGESVRRQASRSWLYLVEVWQDFQRRIDERRRPSRGTMPGPRGSPGNDGCTSSCASWASTRSSQRAASSWTARASRSATGPGTCPCTCSAGPPTWTTRRRTSPPAPRSRWSRNCSTATTPTCGRSCPTAPTLRLLRDSTALVGSSYVEFDLEAIFDGELFSDFVLLYLICHESRFATHGDGGPAVVLPGAVARLRRRAGRAGARPASRRRRAGHLDPRHRVPVPPGQPAAPRPARPAQRRPEAGRLQPRPAPAGLPAAVLVRRRGPRRPAGARPRGRRPDAAARLRQARDRYATYFSSARLRQLARRHRGGRHGDLFEAVQLVFDALGTEGGVPELALPGIGGIFESGATTAGLCPSTSRSPAPGCPTRRCSARCARCRW